MLIPFDTLNNFVGLGVLVMEIGAIAFFVLLYLKAKNKIALEISELIVRFGLWLGFLVTLAALVGSLYYSDILGFTPCGLCWLTRTLIYPQVLIFAVAIFKKDRHIADYIITLSVVGILIGLYQYYLQIGGRDVLPCLASTDVANCADRVFFVYGHITLAWSGVVTFLLLIATALHIRPRS